MLTGQAGLTLISHLLRSANDSVARLVIIRRGSLVDANVDVNLSPVRISVNLLTGGILLYYKNARVISAS